MYLPELIDARRVGSYLVGPYLAMLFTACKSAGAVEYTHVLLIASFCAGGVAQWRALM